MLTACGWSNRARRGSISAAKAPGRAPVKAVLQGDQGRIPDPVALLDVHSSSNGIDFSTSDGFGYKGEAFIAQFGDMAEGVGKVLYPVGFKVVKVNVKTGVVEDFAVNRGKRNGPASRLGAQLIVVGNVGMKGLGRVLGSVASSVALNAPCDVYIVKTAS